MNARRPGKEGRRKKRASQHTVRARLGKLSEENVGLLKLDEICVPKGVGPMKSCALLVRSVPPKGNRGMGKKKI